jgi:hypothetical protein
MREDANFRPVQSTRETPRGRLTNSLRARNLLGAATAVVLLSVFTTGGPTWVYPTFGVVCVVWGLTAAVTATVTPSKRIEMDQSRADE